MNAGGGNPRSKSWSAYWSSGRLHSCADGSADNYQGVIGQFWRDVAGRMRQGARVLDLATGNGPLPLLFWTGRDGEVDIDAVDQAAVAPAWYLPDVHRRIRFHSGVSMESLPFQDGSFDLVVSQYGFEYADRAAALAECLRVAAADASIAMVMHHSGSVLVSVGRAELQHYDQLLGHGGLFDVARAILPVLARMRSGSAVTDPDANHARLDYNRVMADLATSISGSVAPDVLLEARSAVHALVANVRPDTLDASTRALALQADQFTDARLRTAEMVDSAIDRRQMEEMVAQFADARPGSMIGFAELAQAEGVLGWSFTASPGRPV